MQQMPPTHMHASIHTRMPYPNAAFVVRQFRSWRRVCFRALQWGWACVLIVADLPRMCIMQCARLKI
eukprot:4986017-Prorocentrum_lima.AAC.1